MPAWTPPELFDGYRIIRPLGRGGMGDVFLGRDTLLERPVAVKFIAAPDPTEDTRQRFLLEGRAIARLSHPNVVTIYRVGEADGHPYLVSEFVRGQGLDSLKKPLPWEQVLHIGIGLSRGLAAAHRHGVLHRDIKPSNVILTSDGEVKLLDFGVAKLTYSEVPDRSTEGGPGARGLTDTTKALGEITSTGIVVGTPRYMAPEILSGGPATRRSDVFSLGAVLYELCTGKVPPRQADGSIVPLLNVVANVPHGLAAIIDRCLALDPALRLESSDLLLDGLEGLTRTGTLLESVGANPYRGLRAFEAEHRSVFFGREVETRAVVERLRSDKVVVVAGDSGVGKSSLCRAGVLPLVTSGGFGNGRAWVTVQSVPGRRPLLSLVRALAPILRTEADALAAWVSSEPAALARAFQRLKQGGADTGLVVFLDQAEELFTLASETEANLIGEALASLASAHAAAVLVAIRGDFVTKLAALQGIGDRLSHSLFLLRPLSTEALRQVVVGPVRVHGFAFETEAMVDELVSSARRAPGGLPLLQFALAELWDARDIERRLIPSAALDAMGGVKGALARHADTVVANLGREERAEAGRILTRLVTAEGTRSRRTVAELGAETGPAKTALEAMVAGRLLVVRETGGETVCELAHEALIEGWDELRDWLGAAATQRRIAQRLEAAAIEWDRLGRTKDALWHGRQLAEVSGADVLPVGPLETAFLSASRRARSWQRFWRVALLASGPLILGGAIAGSQLRAVHEVNSRVDAQLQSGRAALGEARRAHAEALRRGEEAFALYDGTAGKAPGTLPSPKDVKWDAAEAAWAKALVLQAEADLGYVRATRFFESALLLDGRRRDARQLLGETIYDRLTLAQQRHKRELVAELSESIRIADADGSLQKRLTAPAKLTLTTDPPSAEVSTELYRDEGGQLKASPSEGPHSNRGSYLLPPGSYLLTLRAPGRATIRYPVLLELGGSVTASIRLPATDEVPPGFIYVAPGASLFGSAEDESLRLALDAPPLHRVHTGAYLIARDEFTFGEWLKVLERLPVSLAAKLIPRAASDAGRIAINRSSSSSWSMLFANGGEPYRSGADGRIRYRGRTRNAEQEWSRFPVLAISPGDAIELASASGLPLRLCSEYEWERAARGADGRSFATGNAPPSPGSSNFDLTYGRITEAYGPDEVGLHPESASPFGLNDVQGNALEIVESGRPGGRTVEKGGAWYLDVSYSGRLSRHGALDINTRTILLGVRWCRDVQQQGGTK